MLGRTLGCRNGRRFSGDDAVVASINWLERLEVLKVHIAVVSGGRHKMAVLGDYRSDGLGNQRHTTNVCSSPVAMRGMILLSA